mmetsp:Transcript_24158/g.50602  ORF Transcript_24158/g.50602 Transcript_24158/m.50602 type:complete len:131 (+) Transcript_24158:2-394(+)
MTEDERLYVMGNESYPGRLKFKQCTSAKRHPNKTSSLNFTFRSRYLGFTHLNLQYLLFCKIKSQIVGYDNIHLDKSPKFSQNHFFFLSIFPVSNGFNVELNIICDATSTAAPTNPGLKIPINPILLFTYQ